MIWEPFSTRQGKVMQCESERGHVVAELMMPYNAKPSLLYITNVYDRRSQVTVETRIFRDFDRATRWCERKVEQLETMDNPPHKWLFPKELGGER